MAAKPNSFSLNLGCWLKISELEEMDRYLDLLCEAIKDEQKAFEARVEGIAERLNEEERQDLYSYFEDDYAELNRNFPRLLFSSFVISWFALFENNLIAFCKNLGLTLSEDDNEKAKKEKGITLARYQLVHGANYRIYDKHWEELKFINKTRNLLVHQNGRVKTTIEKSDKCISINHPDAGLVHFIIEQNFYNYLNKFRLLETRGVFYVTPNYAYCKYLVDFGKDFYRRIYSDFGFPA